MEQLRHVLRFVRPIQLLLALLAYSFGLGVARYLGTVLQPASTLLGALILLLMLIVSNLLGEYFRPFNEPLVVGETRKERESLRTLLLFIGVAMLALAALFTSLLLLDHLLASEPALVLAVFALLSLANAVPPFRLIDRGYGELVLALLLAVLMPTTAFLLQAEKLHRLITLFTFPLFLLALVYLLALDFPAYAEDLRYQRRTLLMRLTWQRAIPVHNALLFGAYFFLVAMPFLNVSFSLVWPALFTLPLAAYQIFMFRNIADGAKPLWRVLVVTATAIFGLTVYLLALTFWLH